MINKVYIYILREKNGSEVRYVGQTANPQSRRRDHLNLYSVSESHPKSQWINDANSRNEEIELCVIEECEQDQAHARERYWISHYKEQGHRLTNLQFFNPDLISRLTKDRTPGQYYPGDRLTITLTERDAENMSILQTKYMYADSTEILRRVMDEHRLTVEKEADKVTPERLWRLCWLIFYTVYWMATTPAEERQRADPSKIHAVKDQVDYFATMFGIPLVNNEKGS